MSYVIVCIVALFSGIVQSVTGFGCGIVMMLFFPNILGMIPGAAVSSATSIVLTSSVSFKYRKNIKFKCMIMPTILYVTICTIILNNIKNIDVNLLKTLFGGFLVLLSCYLLFIARNAHFHFSIPVIMFIALFSGTTSGLFSIGGPLMALYFLHMTNSQEEYKGTSQFCFFLTGIISLVTRIVAGLYTRELIPYTLIAMVGILIGEKIGLTISGKINAELTKILVYSFVGVSGIITLAQQLL